MPSSACKKRARSEEHTSELQSHDNLVCRLLLEKNTSDLATQSYVTTPARPDYTRPPRAASRAPPRAAAPRGADATPADRAPSRFFFFKVSRPSKLYPFPQPRLFL